jgi:hypothetical protein
MSGDDRRRNTYEERNRKEMELIRSTAYGFVVCVSVGCGEVSANIHPVSHQAKKRDGPFYYSAQEDGAIAIVACDDGEGRAIVTLQPDEPQTVVAVAEADDLDPEYEERCTFCLFVGADAEARAVRWQEQTVAVEQEKLSRTTVGG